jgi:hypothetical protein
MKTIIPFALLLSIVGSSFAADRPNIIFILADDQGFGDVGALNPDGKIPTPNLDRIADEGMVFTDAHSSSRVGREKSKPVASRTNSSDSSI